MKKDLLLKLAEFLESDAVPKKGSGKFHLGQWMGGYAGLILNYDLGGANEPFKTRNAEANGDRFVRTGQVIEHRHVGDEDEAPPTKYDVIMPVACQTAGCAMGWAACDPTFKELGLHMVVPQHGSANLNTREPDIYFNGQFNEYAAKALFDIDSYIADRLFFPSHYAKEDLDDPLAVARRIREVVAYNSI